MKRYHIWCLSLFSIALTLTYAVADPSADELKAARHRLEEWRKFHPDEIARMQASLKQFQEMPENRRDAIVKLDLDLHSLPEPRRTKYASALDRYADWLERLHTLHPKIWQTIKDSPNAAERFKLIRDQREQEWMESQPKPYRDQFDKLPFGEARTAFIATLRSEERQKREQWIIAQRFWRDLEGKQTLLCRLPEYSESVKLYVTEFLLPYITDAEKKHLANADGRWPDYPMALVEIASTRPTALPPARTEEQPTKFSQFPVPVQQRFADKKAGGVKAKVLLQLSQFEGPNFATKAAEIALRENKLPFGFEYLACNDKSLMKPMQEFVKTQLLPTLKDDADRRKLTDNLGKWPYYAQAIQELSKKHQLTPPWHYLPDAEKYRWDDYRKPKTPKAVLP
ncbi:MAG: hypothetical protein EXS16_17710 [Gemmataceae bacterium]|nr:hypothetical protein [Gemmataceae bacterium]